MAKIMPPHTSTATCCVLASAMRGTFKASEMVAKDNRPSAFVSELHRVKAEERGIASIKLTHCRYNLCLKTILVREPPCKIAHTTLSIAGHVWNLPDVVEHMATSKQQNRNQTNGRPKVAVLYNRQQIRVADTEERDASQHCCSDCYYAHPVDRAFDWRMRSVFKMAADPSMYLLGSLRST